ncbi:MAG: PQQ-dependent sugar dehydrogenase [Gemmatimonadota bacterium]|nr:PQQ-dependent sugar dehydrogenase [Gemmatimonadota bacterium]MDH3421893.1 PQQ-dependent sugar dehydrogenase [Gemmatimonadota bacterium]
MRMYLALAVALVTAAPVSAQVSNDPFPEPIGDSWAPLVVDYTDFARIPGVGGGPPLMTHLLDEPGTQRMFVNDMNGPIHSISYDGRTVRQYVDTNDPRWGYRIQTQGSERGLQSFAFHPQFGQSGAPGYGKFYTWVDIVDTAPTPDFRPGPDGGDSHDTVLLEWTATTPSGATYDGGPPRELMRLEQPYGNHNAGQLAFNPTAAPGSSDYGMLYMGVADGGSGGDPMNMAQNLSSAFGKIFRIDPLGSNSANGKYGIPSDNPFVSQIRSDVVQEIYAYGARNPQKFAWDASNGNLFMADIGQNTVEELTLVPRGANLGWNVWEGSYRYVGRNGVEMSNPRGDRSVTFPVAEYGQPDPLLQGQSAAVGVHVYRANQIRPIANMVLWGDNPSGEIWAIPADDLPNGGQDSIRRVLFNDAGEAKNLVQLIRKTVSGANQADLRLGSGPNGSVFVLNKMDGIVRRLGR